MTDLIILGSDDYLHIHIPNAGVSPCIIIPSSDLAKVKEFNN